MGYPPGGRRKRGRLGSVDLRAPGALVALRMQHEGLDRHAVGERVDAAVEGADLPARDALDGPAELCDRGVLEEHAQVAKALVLAQPHEVSLCRREGVLE